MASAWGTSWGFAWGQTWGDVGVLPIAVETRDMHDGKPRQLDEQRLGDEARDRELDEVSDRRRKREAVRKAFRKVVYGDEPVVIEVEARGDKPPTAKQRKAIARLVRATVGEDTGELMPLPLIESIMAGTRQNIARMRALEAQAAVERQEMQAELEAQTAEELRRNQDDEQILLLSVM